MWQWEGVGCGCSSMVLRPSPVSLSALLQGLLSEAVQWPVLHEQLQTSRQNHGQLWQFFTEHVRAHSWLCVAVGVSVWMGVNSLFLLSRFLLFM